MTEHPPGPWTYDESCNAVTVVDHRNYKVLKATAYGRTLAEIKSTGHLVAAAPDLLEAADDTTDRQVYDILENAACLLGEDEGNSNRVLSMLEKAQNVMHGKIVERRAAIAKAEGGDNA